MRLTILEASVVGREVGVGEHWYVSKLVASRATTSRATNCQTLERVRVGGKAYSDAELQETLRRAGE